MPENLTSEDENETETAGTEVEDLDTEVEEESEEDPAVFTKEYVQSLRNKEAKRRVEGNALKERLAKLEAENKTFKDSQLTEEEKTKQELERLRTENTTVVDRFKDAQINYQVALAASDPGNKIGDVKAAIKLLDRDSLEYDASGTITNLQDALETLKAEYPSVVAVSSRVSAPNTGTTNPAKQTTQKTSYTKAEITAMGPEKALELFKAGLLKDVK